MIIERNMIYKSNCVLVIHLSVYSFWWICVQSLISHMKTLHGIRIDYLLGPGPISELVARKFENGRMSSLRLVISPMTEDNARPAVSCLSFPEHGRKMLSSRSIIEGGC